MAATDTPPSPDWLEKPNRPEFPASRDRIQIDLPSKLAVSLGDIKPDAGLAEKAVPEDTDAPAGVLDRRYDWRNAIPHALALVGATVAILWYVEPFVARYIGADWVMLPLAALWLGQLVQWGYRGLFFRCVLDDGQLCRFRGLLYPRDEPLDCAMIGHVEVRRTFLQRLLNLGDVVVSPEESSGRPPLELAGLRAAKAFADLIEAKAAAAREANVR